MKSRKSHIDLISSSLRSKLAGIIGPRGVEAPCRLEKGRLIVDLARLLPGLALEVKSNMFYDLKEGPGLCRVRLKRGGVYVSLPPGAL